MPKLVLNDVVAQKLTQALNAEEDLVLTHQEALHVLKFLVDEPDPNIPPPGMFWTVLIVTGAPQLNESMNKGWEPFGVSNGAIYLRKLTD